MISHQDHLYQMLRELNTWLEEHNRRLEIHVMGGLALELHGIRIGRRTEDLDNLTKIQDQDIIDQIHAIGERHQLPRWFDLGASSITAPDGYRDRLIKIELFSHLDIFVLSKADLVCLKVSAFFQRSQQGIVRDWEDLLKLTPSESEIDNAISFIIENAKDLPLRFQQELREELHEFKKELKKQFNS